MAFERVDIAPNSDSSQSSQPQLRTEERVIDPYRQRAPKAAADPKIGQSDKKEGVALEAPKPTEESVTLSPAAAALARKEQGVRQRELALKTKEDALEAERAEIAQLKAIKAKLAAKDYSGVEELIKYDEFTNYLIEKEQGQDPTAQALKKLETKIGEVEANQKSDTDKRYAAAVDQRRQAVTALVASNEEFSTIKALKAEEHVVQHILDSWEQDNIDLSPEQAAKEVEQIILEKAKVVASLPKLKVQADVVPAEKNLPPLKIKNTTLTNNLGAVGDLKRPLKPLHGLPDSERWAEARRRVEERSKEKK